MIDREKVIKGLECCASMSGSTCRECPYSSECIEGVGTSHLAANALALLKERESGWISTQDRMPDKSGEYIVSGGGKVWVCQMLVLDQIGAKGWIDSVRKPCVEAWMPLPESYKKDGDIRVGDEVVFRKEHDDSDRSKCVVTHIDDDGYIQGITQDGSAFISKGPCWQKTGKRYPIVMDLMNELQRVQR